MSTDPYAYEAGDVIPGTAGLFVALGVRSDPWFHRLGGSVYASDSYGPGPGRRVERAATDEELLAIHAAASRPVSNDDASIRAAECRVRSEAILAERGVSLEGEEQPPAPGFR